MVGFTSLSPCLSPRVLFRKPFLMPCLASSNSAEICCHISRVGTEETGTPPLPVFLEEKQDKLTKKSMNLSQIQGSKSQMHVFCDTVKIAFYFFKIDNRNIR